MEINIIETGILKDSSLRKAEMQTLYGGRQEPWCGINACGGDACAIELCVLDVCGLEACVTNFIGPFCPAFASI